MELCYVTSRYRPHTGGVETHVAELATRFADRGHEVTVVAADRGTRVDDHRLPAHERISGVRVRRVRALAPGGAVHIAPGVVRAIKRADPDLIHAHNYHSLPFFFTAIAASRLDGVPLVATPHYHGGSASGVRDQLLSLYRPLGGWALHRADAVLAVSDWEANQLSVDFDLSAQVIKNGINIDRFRDAKVRVNQSDQPYILSVGRLESYKGIQHIIRALPNLPDYHLVVVGDGPFQEQLCRIAEETGVVDRVDFRGFVPDERIPGIYAGAAAFVTMSEFESYGITVAESLAAGTPCVIRPAGALIDWADRDDCVAVDPEALAEGVQEAVGRPAPTERLQSWTGMVESVSAVYDKLRKERQPM